MMLEKMVLAGLASALVLGVSGVPAHAQEPAPGLMEDEEMTSEGLTPEVMEQINSLLAGMDCEVDPGNIEAQNGGYELDDVFCADGQYDLELDSNLNETNRRKE
jgi:hypothetical protein